MKNRKITLACLIASSAFVIASCSKKSDDSVHTRLTAKWKIYKTGYDINRNGVMDADETDTTSSSIITFSGDGTAKTENPNPTNNETFTWTLQNNDADILLKSISGNAAGSQGTFHIEALTSTDLNISHIDSASSIKSWTMMKKQ